MQDRVRCPACGFLNERSQPSCAKCNSPLEELSESEVDGTGRKSKIPLTLAVAALVLIIMAIGITARNSRNSRNRPLLLTPKAAQQIHRIASRYSGVFVISELKEEHNILPPTIAITINPHTLWSERDAYVYSMSLCRDVARLFNYSAHVSVSDEHPAPGTDKVWMQGMALYTAGNKYASGHYCYISDRESMGQGFETSGEDEEQQ